MTKLFRLGDRVDWNDRIVCLTDGNFRTSEQASVRSSWEGSRRSAHHRRAFDFLSLFLWGECHSPKLSYFVDKKLLADSSRMSPRYQYVPLLSVASLSLPAEPQVSQRPCQRGDGAGPKGSAFCSAAARVPRGPALTARQAAVKGRPSFILFFCRQTRP